MDRSVPPGEIQGELTPPCSKSYAQRALAAALLAEGESTLRNIELCDDTRSAMRCIDALGADVTVVDKDNYKTVLNDDLLGCLIRFEGLRSSYTTVDSNTYPNYLENVNGVYTNKYYQDEGLPITWAYNYANTKYYGSSLFTYETTPTSLESGSYVVRVSGYARFALKELPADNAMVNITAIYTKYSSRTGGFITYQLLVSSYKDIEEL